MKEKLFEIEESFCEISELFGVLYDGLNYQFEQEYLPSGYIILLEQLKAKIDKFNVNF